MTEAAPKKDVRRVWLVEDEANLSAARMAKHRLVEQVRRLVDVTSQLDVGDVGYEPGGAEAETGDTADTADTDRAAQFMALAAEAEALADRIGALPLIPRMEADGLNASQARRHDILPVKRSTSIGRANPPATPVQLWADGERRVDIRSKLACNDAFVTRWTSAFGEQGLAGLVSLYPGRAPKTAPARLEA